MGGWTAGFGAVVRAVFGREELPAPPPRPPATPGSRGVLSRAFAPDPFPSDLPPAPRRPGRLLSWLFVPEDLGP